MVGEVRAHPYVQEEQCRDPAELDKMTVEIGTQLVSEEGAQRRRTPCRDERLRHAVVGGPEKHDVTVAPRLLGRPGDDLLMVGDVLRIEKRDLLAGRAAHSAPLDDHRAVPAVGDTGGEPISLVPVGMPAV
jgi:hypothetical protein